jgi:hypothetical protein
VSAAANRPRTRRAGESHSAIPDDSLDAKRAKRFRALVRDLNALLADVRRDWPEANYYLQEDNLHILSGPSHEGWDDRPQEHRSLADETLARSGGGGW